jgi:hypothetical protein
LSGGSKVPLGAAAIGLAGSTAAFFALGPERFWINWIFWFIFLLTVGLGALFVVAVEHLVNARWSVPIRRASERVAGLILLAAPLGLVALFSLPSLYEWTRPEVVAARPMLAGKSGWLNIPFFSIRTVVCVVLWIVSYRILVGGSFRQDETRDPAQTVRARRFAPIFMIIFALTITLVAFDWVSSLEPEWYSDIFGVYIFGGSFLAGLAATTLVVLHLEARGRLRGVRFDHRYNLGGFLFAFTVFWSYIAFAQYMLMWYANLPEEVFWYKDRIDGAWLPVTLALALVHFVIPFFALSTRDSKGDPRRLRWVAILVLAAHALDLYWLLFPFLGKTPVLGWGEVAFALLFLGAGLAWVGVQMRRGADMPVGDPFLAEGLEFRL